MLLIKGTFVGIKPVPRLVNGVKQVFHKMVFDDKDLNRLYVGIENDEVELVNKHFKPNVEITLPIKAFANNNFLNIKLDKGRLQLT